MKGAMLVTNGRGRQTQGSRELDEVRWVIACIVTVTLATVCSSCTGSEVTEVSGNTGMCTNSEPRFSGEPLEGLNLPGSAVEAVVSCPESEMSDSRLSGATESEFRCEYSHRDGEFVAECVSNKVVRNEGGTWQEEDGTFTITDTGFPADGVVVQEGLMVGTGDYEGLQFDYRMEGIEHAYPWSITGTIEPTS